MRLHTSVVVGGTDHGKPELGRHPAVLLLRLVCGVAGVLLLLCYAQQQHLGHCCSKLCIRCKVALTKQLQTVRALRALAGCKQLRTAVAYFTCRPLRCLLHIQSQYRH